MPDVQTWVQHILTRLAQDEHARRVVQAPRVSREVVGRYVAGEDDAELVGVATQLLSRGRMLTVTRLSPQPTDLAELDALVAETVACVDRLEADAVAGAFPGAPPQRPLVEVSVAPTQLGLGALPFETVGSAVHDLLAACTERGALLTVQSEDTIASGAGGPADVLPLVERLRDDTPDVGVALHAGLRRTEADCRRLTGAGVRVVLLKGHHANAEGYHRRRAAVDQNFVRCLRVLMEGDGYPVVATNDLRLLRLTQALAEYVGRTPDTFEYQVRFGVRPEMQAVIADRGDQLRVFTPYGPDWYPYLVSRLAEQPANLFSMVRTATGR